ncbi:NAD(P)-dependent oxidoreductase [Mucilaginibacter sp. HMF5004]|uniref:NAD(P)-dependent oxidoreductase n=1 Tax=Mucilaginibacter rivuli TaxID=2857527 RepID=UPI001C607D4F|nr:NAD(P)-dependent oxidoreductase [Mucilaginibacter rivuli]MBW4890742.1 NAD(P)-dependent oxidoreductase [Mucilaginibacter rivuli]
MENKIGFIGLGNMGMPMAQNLIKAGYHLQVYNRTAGKANALDPAFTTICKTPAEAAANVKLVVTMLSQDDILKETVLGEDGVLKTLQPGAVHISMSTIAPETSEELSMLHEATGSHYIASPVFGRPEAAAAKKLFVCTSGNAEAKKLAHPVLEALGQSVHDFGGAVGAANVLKITGNFMIIASLELMAEAFTLAEKSGLDRARVAEFFGATIFNAPIYQNYGKLIANKTYTPVGFKAKLGLKDARLALNLSELAQVPMPLAKLAHKRLFDAVEKGDGDKDWVEAFGKGVSEDAGL